MSMMGPLWDVGHVSQDMRIFEPAFAGAAVMAFVADLWQIISGLVYAAGATNPLSRTLGVFHPEVMGAGVLYWYWGL